MNSYNVWFVILVVFTFQGRISLAPFFYVNFADFWLADQLNSLSVALLDVESFGCWVAWGNHNPGKPYIYQIVSDIESTLKQIPFQNVAQLHMVLDRY